MNPIVARTLRELQFFPTQEHWEKVVVDVSLSVLIRTGPSGLTKLRDHLTEVSLGMEYLGEGAGLTLRETSDILSVLESAEADRVERVHSLIKEILRIAVAAAEELLKAALGGLL